MKMYIKYYASPRRFNKLSLSSVTVERRIFLPRNFIIIYMEMLLLNNYNEQGQNDTIII